MCNRTRSAGSAGPLSSFFTLRNPHLSKEYSVSPSLPDSCTRWDEGERPPKAERVTAAGSVGEAMAVGLFFSHLSLVWPSRPSSAGTSHTPSADSHIANSCVNKERREVEKEAKDKEKERDEYCAAGWASGRRALHCNT